MKYKIVQQTNEAVDFKIISSLSKNLETSDDE